MTRKQILWKASNITALHTEGPATLLQSCTECLKSVEILQSFSLKKVNFSVNYAILSVISFVKHFRELLRKFTARKPQFCMILRHTIFHYNLTISENSSRLYKLGQELRAPRYVLL